MFLRKRGPTHEHERRPLLLHCTTDAVLSHDSSKSRSKGGTLIMYGLRTQSTITR